ncbi:GNAT family N-acetyltransferase [Herbaspirillum camelliae]|uniref:GNAT family N-acetyltransferase n=1 Tax=Herbaspirillum camelliae TaxID=1892903 RepID=UPI0009F9DF0A|nr:GNAT family N-acetyltransferase [Herbaspirillum camelliae]
MNMPLENRELSIQIKVVRQFQQNMFAQAFLAGFYGVEMAKAFGWSAEQRFRQMLQAQSMLAAGESRMYMAETEAGSPVGMIVTTKTSDRTIRRLESIWVGNSYRRRGVARRLFAEARLGGADFHSFAAPEAVDWHLANGFRALGDREEGTVEMFTGAYNPKYKFSYRVPQLTEADQQHLRSIEEFELNFQKK